jgi:hypothetical protein
MQPSSDCWRSSSLGASSKTFSTTDQQAEGITGRESIQRLHHLCDLSWSIVRLTLPGTSTA